MRFDYFERLVGERRAIDGDLAPHSPRRVTQRILHCRPRELRVAPVAEWSAGSGEHHPTQLRCRMAGDALQDRAVLAVHGDDLARARRARPPDEVAGDDESL